MLPIPVPPMLDDDDQFYGLLAECLDRLDRGQNVDLEEIGRQWPQYRASIEDFLADRQSLIQSLQSPVNHTVQPPPIVNAAFRRWADQPTRDFRAATDVTPDQSSIHNNTTLTSIGPYEVEKVLARGGMGVVYKARQPGIERIVALKMILMGRLATSDEVDRFKREVRAAGTLVHPNIVRIHEAGRFTGQPFFTMDYIDGVSLAERLAKGSLPAREAASLTATLARAIGYAHQRGVIHRDLKPANILLDRDGTPHVTDFGLAKLRTSYSVHASELTNTGQILGTPGYMSPEQAAAKHDSIAEPTDIYSLGAILYTCLTGRAPFVAETPLETLAHVVNHEPASIQLLNPDVPGDLETICLRCLNKEPSQRYPTAVALADDLDRFLQGRPIYARRAGLWTHFVKWCRRRPEVAALTAVFAIVVSFAFVAVAYWWLQAEDAKVVAEQATLESRTHLSESLVGQAISTRNARRSGYRRDVWKLLQRARALPGISHDLQRIRQEAVLCLGDFVADEAITIDGTALQRSNNCALFLDDHHILVAENGGDVSIRDLASAAEVSRIARYGLPIRAACVLSDGGLSDGGLSDGVLSDGVLSDSGMPDDRSSVLLSDLHHLERWDRHPRGSWTRQWQIRADFPYRLDHLAVANDRVFFPDGSRIRIVSVITGETQGALELPFAETAVAAEPFRAVAVSRNGRFVAAARSSAEIAIWDASEDRILRRLKPGMSGTPQLQFDSESEFLIIGSHEGVVVYDTEDFSQDSRFRTESIKSLSASPTETKLLFLTQSGIAELWDLQSPSQMASLRHPGEISGSASVRFSPSGNRFLSSSRDQIRVWDLRGEGELISLPAHRNAIQHLVGSESQDLFASCSRDSTIRFWSSNSGRPVSRVQLAAPIQSIAFSPCGRWFAAATDHEIHLWQTHRLETSALKSQRVATQQIRDLCFDSSGSRLFVTGTEGTDCWEIAGLRQAKLPTLRLAHSIPVGGFQVDYCDREDTLILQTPEQVAVFTSDDLRLKESLTTAIAGERSAWHFVDGESIWKRAMSGAIERIDLADGNRSTVAIPDRVYPDKLLAVSSVGRCVAILHEANQVALYDCSTGRLIFELPSTESVITAINWHREGHQLAIGLSDGRVLLWNLDRVAKMLREAELWGELALWEKPSKVQTVIVPRQQKWEVVDQAVVRQTRMQQLLRQWAVPEPETAVDQAQRTGLPPSLIDQIGKSFGAASELDTFVLALPTAELDNLSNQLNRHGYRIRILRPYPRNGSQYVAAQWTKDATEREYQLGLTRAELSRKIDAMNRSGYVLAGAGGYRSSRPGVGLRFFALFEPAHRGNADSRYFVEERLESASVRQGRQPLSEQVLTSQLCFDTGGVAYRCELRGARVSDETVRIVETLPRTEFQQQAGRYSQNKIHDLSVVYDAVSESWLYTLVHSRDANSVGRPLLCHEPLQVSREVAQQMMNVGYRPTQIVVTSEGHATILFDLPGSQPPFSDRPAAVWMDI